MSGDLDELRDLLDEISKVNMPFGKFGPEHFPPKGIPLYDLPYEYLSYFARKGFPRGRLGELMKFIYQVKLDGADAIFAQIRERNGGRTSLRKTKQRNWNFK